MRLAGIYEVLNEPRKALDLVYQGASDVLFFGSKGRRIFEVLQ